MKIIGFLKNITLFEILLNTILAVMFVIGIATKIYDFSSWGFIGIAILHVSSMILHWLAWKQLPVTLNARKIFNLWVFGSFVITFLVYFIFPSFISTVLFVFAFFAILWFVSYCLILIQEYIYLKHKKDLYEKRELIHF